MREYVSDSGEKMRKTKGTAGLLILFGIFLFIPFGGSSLKAQNPSKKLMWELIPYSNGTFGAEIKDGQNIIRVYRRPGATNYSCRIIVNDERNQLFDNDKFAFIFFDENKKIIFQPHYFEIKVIKVDKDTTTTSLEVSNEIINEMKLSSFWFILGSASKDFNNGKFAFDFQLPLDSLKDIFDQL